MRREPGSPARPRWTLAPLRRLAPALFAAGLLASASASANQTVNVGPGLAFTPATVTVVPGETVTWIFVERGHSTTSNATTGPEFWDSGVVSTTGATFVHTFTTPGTYPYYCSVHSSPTGTAMNGVVQVVPATPTPTSTSTPTPTVVPTSTPTVVPAGAATIPALDPRGLGILAVLLAATAFLVLARPRR